MKPSPISLYGGCLSLANRCCHTTITLSTIGIGDFGPYGSCPTWGAFDMQNDFLVQTRSERLEPIVCLFSVGNLHSLVGVAW
jgi:hypothetical protein